MEEIIALAKPVYAAVMSGNYTLAAALALVLAVAVARRYLTKRVPWLGTDVGGSVLVLLASLGGAVATATAAGASLTWGLAWTALGVAVTAAGGYQLLRRLVTPLIAKAPAWLQPVLNLVFWFLDNRKATAAAAKAGKDAVTKSPGKGASAIVGQPRDL